LGVCHDEINLELGQKIHGVFAALVDFGLAPLVAAPLDFSQRHAFDSESSQGVFDILQPKRLNDGFYLFHRDSFRLPMVECPVGKTTV